MAGFFFKLGIGGFFVAQFLRVGYIFTIRKFYGWEDDTTEEY